MSSAFNRAIALGALFMLLPVFIVLALAIKLDSTGPVFFHHDRVGVGWREFRVHKFRTMSQYSMGLSVTTGRDSRITRVGAVLRKTKLDELPQLFNVLVGEMNIVGPRPEIRGYIDCYASDYEEILTVKPGITGPAAVFFRNEQELLDTSSDPERFYLEQVLPKKIALDKSYVHGRCLRLDLRLIVQTLKVLVG